MILDAWHRMVARRRTARELARLSDDDLADIGLTRSQIADCAAGEFIRPGI